MCRSGQIQNTHTQKQKTLLKKDSWWELRNISYSISAANFDTLTWIGGSDKGRCIEEAVPVVPPMELIVAVHGVGRMGRERVGPEARLAFLNGRAIGAPFPARKPDCGT